MEQLQEVAKTSYKADMEERVWLLYNPCRPQQDSQRAKLLPRRAPSASRKPGMRKLFARPDEEFYSESIKAPDVCRSLAATTD